jgi:hypothetical protein
VVDRWRESVAGSGKSTLRACVPGEASVFERTRWWSGLPNRAAFCYSARNPKRRLTHAS